MTYISTELFIVQFFPNTLHSSMTAFVVVVWPPPVGVSSSGPGCCIDFHWTGAGCLGGGGGVGEW